MKLDAYNFGLVPQTLKELKAGNRTVWRDENGKYCYLAKNGELEEVQ